jgi:serine/threonine protein kinase
MLIDLENEIRLM